MNCWTFGDLIFQLRKGHHAEFAFSTCAGMGILWSPGTQKRIDIWGACKRAFILKARPSVRRCVSVFSVHLDAFLFALNKTPAGGRGPRPGEDRPHLRDGDEGWGSSRARVMKAAGLQETEPLQGVVKGGSRETLWVLLRPDMEWNMAATPLTCRWPQVTPETKLLLFQPC